MRAKWLWASTTGSRLRSCCKMSWTSSCRGQAEHSWPLTAPRRQRARYPTTRPSSASSRSDSEEGKIMGKVLMIVLLAVIGLGSIGQPALAAADPSGTEELSTAEKRRLFREG